MKLYELKHTTSEDGGYFKIGIYSQDISQAPYKDLSMASEWGLFVSKEVNNKQAKFKLKTYLDKRVLPTTRNFDILSC